ncbi:hypothetical protein QFZ63_004204 [Streptomyces sp. B3I7]|nr:hypothetical protein [Streptomyces sp. B3I7]
MGVDWWPIGQNVGRRWARPLGLSHLRPRQSAHTRVPAVVDPPDDVALPSADPFTPGFQMRMAARYQHMVDSVR